MPASIPRYLTETAQAMPDKVAIVSSARSITFGELYNEALATAECLREMGIAPGDRVGMCMEKTIDQVLGDARSAVRQRCGRSDPASAQAAEYPSTSSRTRAWRR